MPRRYRRRYKIARPVKVTKYSNETFGGEIDISNTTGQANSHGLAYVQVVPSVSNILGTRKCKNFTLRIKPQVSTTTQQGQDPPPPETSSPFVGFALVYVPEGNVPSQLQYGSNSAVSVYEPNQNVILSGILDENQVYTFKTRLARNLNAGDQLALVLYDFTPGREGYNVITPVNFLVNFAISF